MNCLDEILNYYKKKETRQSQAIYTWINHFLINLMGDLEEENPRNYLKVRNCLIVLINLFFETEYPDHYHLIGVPIQEIPKNEKMKCIEILKSEIINCN